MNMMWIRFGEIRRALKSNTRLTLAVLNRIHEARLFAMCQIIREAVAWVADLKKPRHHREFLPLRNALEWDMNEVAAVLNMLKTELINTIVQGVTQFTSHRPPQTQETSHNSLWQGCDAQCAIQIPTYRIHAQHIINNLMIYPGTLAWGVRCQLERHRELLPFWRQSGRASTCQSRHSSIVGS